jgi:3-oxoacyl-[acyl-carrier-protein] synthase-3
MTIADLRRTPGPRLLGFGAARPAGMVPAADLAAPFGKDAEWIETRSGIRTVHRLAAGESVHRLAEDAARAALAHAAVAAADVDLVITASCSVPGGPFEAPLTVGGLTPSAASLHLNAACSGFCYALSTADAQVRSGQANTVLVVAAEHMSRYLDPSDLGTWILFGDGAGAAVVGRGDGLNVIGPAVWGSDGAQWHLIRADASTGGALRMDGRAVFRWAVEQAAEVAQAACARAGVALSEIDVFVPHQANLRIIEAVARRAGLTKAVIASDIVVSGNTSAASIPLALTQLCDEGRLGNGQLALLAGFGAGLTFAAQVVGLP